MPDNNNRCPLCGKETQDNEAFCRDCREIARNSYHKDLLSDDKPVFPPIIGESANDDESGFTPGNDTADHAQDGSPPPGESKQDTFCQRNKKSLIFLFVCLGLFIIAGVAGGYIRKQNMNAEATELAFWNKCIEENTPLGYSKYLVKFPEGKFSDEAHRKIVKLRNDERKSWEKLRYSNDADALFAFLTDHPETPYVRDVRHAIDSLSWLAARKQNTADVYLAYIENAKIGRLDGEYIDIARERYDYLSQLKTLEGKELNEVKNMMAGFFKAMSSNNSKEIQKLSADTLKVFYKSENFLSKHIVDSLKTGYKAEKIRSVLYTPVTDSIEAVLDNKGICFITLPVKREITYMDKKKKKDHTQSVLNIELDNKRLQTIHVKSGRARP
jgi:hypothetical protein